MAENTDRMASITEILDFFQMDAGTMMKSWKTLSDEEKTFFKIEVGKVLPTVEGATA